MKREKQFKMEYFIFLKKNGLIVIKDASSVFLTILPVFPTVFVIYLFRSFNYC